MSENSKKEWIDSSIVIVSVILGIISIRLFRVTMIAFSELLLISVPLGIIAFALLYKKIKEFHLLYLLLTIVFVGLVVSSVLLGSNYCFADTDRKEVKLKVLYSHSTYSKSSHNSSSMHVVATYEGTEHTFVTPYETYIEYKDNPFKIQATLRTGFWGYPVIDDWKLVSE